MDNGSLKPKPVHTNLENSFSFAFTAKSPPMGIHRNFKLEKEKGSRGFSQKRPLIHTEIIQIILESILRLSAFFSANICEKKMAVTLFVFQVLFKPIFHRKAPDFKFHL
jgi:hypothetical protein